MANYGQDVVDRGTERLKGTWEYAGETYDLIVEDIERGDKQLIQRYMSAIAPILQAEENDSDIDESDIEAIENELEALGSYSWMDNELGDDPLAPVVSEKLIQPQADPAKLPDRKFEALITGMMETWQESDEIAEAREEMPLEGNA